MYPSEAKKAEGIESTKPQGAAEYGRIHLIAPFTGWYLITDNYGIQLLGRHSESPCDRTLGLIYRVSKSIDRVSIPSVARLVRRRINLDIYDPKTHKSAKIEKRNGHRWVMVADLRSGVGRGGDGGLVIWAILRQRGRKIIRVSPSQVHGASSGKSPQ